MLCFWIRSHAALRQMDLAVDATQLTELRSILKRYASGCTVWASGSQVRSAAQTRPLTRHFDLDLALNGQALSLTQMAMLGEALADSNLPFRVDVTAKSSLPADWALEFYGLPG